MNDFDGVGSDWLVSVDKPSLESTSTNRFVAGFVAGFDDRARVPEVPEVFTGAPREEASGSIGALPFEPLKMDFISEAKHKRDWMRLR